MIHWTDNSTIIDRNVRDRCLIGFLVSMLVLSTFPNLIVWYQLELENYIKYYARTYFILHLCLLMYNKVFDHLLRSTVSAWPQLMTTPQMKTKRFQVRMKLLKSKISSPTTSAVLLQGAVSSQPHTHNILISKLGRLWASQKCRKLLFIPFWC